MPRPDDNAQLNFLGEIKTEVRDVVRDAVRSTVRRTLGSEIGTRQSELSRSKDLSAYPASMTVGQVAAALNCSKKHVYNLYDAGKLQAFDIGTQKQQCLRFKRDHVARYIASFLDEPETTPAAPPRNNP